MAAIFDPSDVIDELDNKKLNEHKDNIVKYFQENNIDKTKLFSIPRKEFGETIAQYCDDKKVKGALMKLYKTLEKQKDNDQNDDQPPAQPDPVPVTDPIPDQKIDEPQPPAPSSSSSSCIDPSPIIDELDNKKLTEHKDSIIKYFNENNIDNNKLFNDMTRKEFGENLAGYVDDKKGKGAFMKLYKNLEKLKDNTAANDQQPPSQAAPPVSQPVSQPDPVDQKNDAQPRVPAAGVSYYDPSPTIDELDNVKLNEHKDKIIKYFQENNIDETKLFNLSRKEFGEGLAGYVDDKKGKGAFMKLYKNFEKLKDAKNDQQQPPQAAVSGASSYFDPTQIIEEIDNKKLNEHKENIIKYFKDNNIDKTQLTSTPRKEFGEGLAAFCDDKRGKAAFMKLHKKIADAGGVAAAAVSVPVAVSNNDDPKEAPFILKLIKCIDSINHDLLNQYKDAIIQYFKQNSITYDALFVDGRKDFMDKMAEHCNEKKIKAPSKKLYVALMLVDNDVKPQAAAAVVQQAPAVQQAQSSNCIDPTTVIDQLNNKKLNEYKDNVIKYFGDNNIDSTKFKSIPRKEFGINLSNYCNDPKAKGAFMKLYKTLEKDLDNMDQKDDNKQMEEEKSDMNYNQPLAANIKSINDCDNFNLIIIVNQLINIINKPKLNDAKKQIIRWFETKNINGRQWLRLDKKAFALDLTTHCNDNKLKGVIFKLHKSLHDNENSPQNLTARASNASRKDLDIVKIVPQTDDVKNDDDDDNDNKDQDDESDDDEEEEEEEEKEQVSLENLMPTYINRAIWYRSEDETLERLIDKAVKAVLRLTTLWAKPDFVKSLYKKDTFEDNVDKIYKLKFNFFNKFVSDTFKRELSIEAMKDEAKNKGKKKVKDDDNDDDDDDDYNKKKKKKDDQKDDYNYTVWYAADTDAQDDTDGKDDNKDDNKDNKDIKHLKKHSKQDSLFGRAKGSKPFAMVTKSMRTPKTLRGLGGATSLDTYHIYTKDQQSKKPTCVTTLDVHDPPMECNWAVWKRKAGKKNPVVRRALQSSQPTFGYWEILNSKKAIEDNDKKNIKLQHLNIIFELLRYYFKQRIKIKNSPKLMEEPTPEIKHFLQTIAGDKLRETYCTDLTDKWKEVKTSIEIEIHEGLVDNSTTYQLTWWNCAKRTHCNAFAIKCLSAEPDKVHSEIKEKFYMRFAINSLQHTPVGITSDNKIEWDWYNNDNAEYKEFIDYTKVNDAKTAHKKGLLHRQLEAIYLSNMDKNFPWELFDVPKKHTFNRSQITHLKPALEEHLGKKIGTLGYLCRFARLSFEYKPDKSDKLVEVNLILNIEQVAVNKNSMFPRNARRMFNGENSLLLQYSGANIFINKWLRDYYLFTQDQKLYFWAFILCIAAKIKQMDIEVENQLVTIPKQIAFSAPKGDAFNSGDVRQEQQDTLLYQGFLVPPSLGEQVADPSQFGNEISMRKVRENIESLSQTRILRKAKIGKQALSGKDDEAYVCYQVHGGDQYKEVEAVLFRFGELIRKYILEATFLKDDGSLWPYYLNYHHRNDHSVYHRLINRYNLSLMFTSNDIFELLAEKEDDDIGCFDHFSCKDADDDDKKEEDDPEKDKLAIRHKRKFASAMLLQKWDSLRNLNVVRHQLRHLFNNIIENEDDKSQKEMVEEAKKFDENDGKLWEDKIVEVNTDLETNLLDNDYGWQYLSEYNSQDPNSLEITTKQYPFYDSFIRKFLLKTVDKAREKDIASDKEGGRIQWYSMFLRAWRLTPSWWTNKHDIILVELALRFNIDHSKYVMELKGDTQEDYMMRLQSTIAGFGLAGDADNNGIDDDDDESRLYLEFQHWCSNQSNILHRLKYITNIMIKELTVVEPSMITVMMTKDNKDDFKSGLIFSQYDADVHIKSVSTKKRTFDRYLPISMGVKDLDITTKEEKEDPKLRKQQQELAAVITDDFTILIRDEIKKWKQEEKDKQDQTASDGNKKHTKDTKTMQVAKSLLGDKKIKSQIELQIRMNYKDSDDPQPQPNEPLMLKKKTKYWERRKLKQDKTYLDDENAILARVTNPFICRDLEQELQEVVFMFDVVKYGREMSKFVIDEIREYAHDELWKVLEIVMEAIPFQMGMEVLNQELDTLRRGDPEQVYDVCKNMVDGTNAGVAANLRMAEFFLALAESDALQEDTWMEYQQGFEDSANKSINEIESDHLLYVLLSVPLSDTKEPMSIIQLALEQGRLNFLNNERILGVIKHVWNHGTSVSVEEHMSSADLGWGDLLQRLFFQPFKFYFSPIGFNWTIAILFLLYLMYVLGYSYFIVKGHMTLFFDRILWFFNLGYITYEMSEFVDKGREYFAVSGIMNMWDILICTVWIILFIIRMVGLIPFNDFIKYGTGVDDAGVTPSPDEIFMSTTEHPIDFDTTWWTVYTILFAFQLFLLSTRFLTLFQNTEYLGGLIKIVQKMSGQIVKFLSVVIVVVGAFTFAFFFIFSFTHSDGDAEAPTAFFEVILFTFDEFVGGGTDDSSIVGALFTIILTVVGAIILTNILIALMTSEYENFQDTAIQEVSFLRIETTFDIANRDRLLPPPLNLLAYGVGAVVHVCLIPFALIKPTSSCCNMYTRFGHNTYTSLFDCYCGCNKKMKHKIKLRALHNRQHNTNQDILHQQSKKLYSSRLNVFGEFTGLNFCKRTCFKILGRASDENARSSLQAYHKNCYNCIKLKVKDPLTDQWKTDTHGIKMKEYIQRYEHAHKTKLQLEDAMYLKHLTADTLFCDQCYSPFRVLMDKDVDEILLGPVRVLLDLVSCILFLVTAWPPMVAAFSFMAFWEWLGSCCGSDAHERDDERDKFSEFDREYFPHPSSQDAQIN